MRCTPKWLLGFCLIGLCITASTFQHAVAQTSSQTASVPSAIFPKYLVLGVVYAPPGSASFVNYGNSTTVGSTNTIAQSTTFSVDNKLTLGYESSAANGAFSYSANVGETTGYSTTTTGSDSFTVQTGNGNSITTLGPISSALGVNHDNDVIYILLNPMYTSALWYNPNNTMAPISTLWSGVLSNSCDLTDPNGTPTLYQAMSSCDPNQYPYPDIVGIPVWCLKNPYYPGQGCAQWLQYTSRSWDHSYRGPATSSQSGPWPADPTNPPGLTLQDYADILRADPFVAQNGSSVNVCHQTYNQNLDPNDPEVMPSSPLNEGAVVYVIVPNNLNGYSGAPVVTFSGGGASSNATAVANWVNGQVVSLTLTNGGSGYTSAPTVSLNGTPVSSIVAFISDQSANTNCGLLGGTPVNRFQAYGAIEFPVPGPNGLPSTYAGNFSLSNEHQTTSTSSDTHTTGFSLDQTFTVKSPGALSIFATAKFSFSDDLSTTNKTTMEQNNISDQKSSYTAAYSITGPQLSDNYTGPATYNVYLDNVYGTFAFYSDLEPPVTLGTIGVTSLISCPPPSVPQPAGCVEPSSFTTIPIPVFGPTQVGTTTSTSTYVPVTLINQSSHPLTMVWPAVTFDDPGFQLVQSDPNHPDGCSNQYLLPYGSTNSPQTYYCTLYIEFAPLTSDASNPITLANTPAVQANMIAAGTENASAYQNILVTSQTPVSGVAQSATQGATLLANANLANGVVLYNPIPNVYAFTTPSTVSGGLATPQTEPFTFTNYNSAGVTITSVSWTDIGDFTVIPSGNTPCVALTNITDAGTCTFTLQFQPSSASITAGTNSFSTGITVWGTVGGSSSVVALATAGAAGTLSNPPIFTISPDGGEVDDDCIIYTDQQKCTQNNPSLTVYITNTTPQPLTLTLSYQINGVNPPSENSNTCGSGSGTYTITLGTTPSNSSCWVTYGYSDSSQGGQNGNEMITVSGTQNGTSLSETAVTWNYYTQTTVQSCYCPNVIILKPQPLTQTQTVTAGSTAQYPFNIAPVTTTYPGVVSFAATGLPAGATANFSPATLAANAGAQTVTLSVKTAAASASLQQPGLGRRLSPIMLALLLLPLGAVRRVRKSRRRLLQLVSVIGLFAALAGGGLTGCGTSNAPSSSASAPQAYTIVVTATSGGASQSANVYLTIQ